MNQNLTEQQRLADTAARDAMVEAALAAGATPDEALKAAFTWWDSSPSGLAWKAKNTPGPVYTDREYEMLHQARILATKRGWAAPTMPDHWAPETCDCCGAGHTPPDRLLFNPKTGEALTAVCRKCYEIAKVVNFDSHTAERIHAALTYPVHGRRSDEVHDAGRHPADVQG